MARLPDDLLVHVWGWLSDNQYVRVVSRRWDTVLRSSRSMEVTVVAPAHRVAAGSLRWLEQEAEGDNDDDRRCIGDHLRSLRLIGSNAGEAVLRAIRSCRHLRRLSLHPNATTTSPDALRQLLCDLATSAARTSNAFALESVELHADGIAAPEYARAAGVALGCARYAAVWMARHTNLNDYALLRFLEGFSASAATSLHIDLSQNRITDTGFRSLAECLARLTTTDGGRMECVRLEAGYNHIRDPLGDLRPWFDAMRPAAGGVALRDLRINVDRDFWDEGIIKANAPSPPPEVRDILGRLPNDLRSLHLSAAHRCWRWTRPIALPPRLRRLHLSLRCGRLLGPDSSVAFAAALRSAAGALESLELGLSQTGLEDADYALILCAGVRPMRRLCHCFLDLSHTNIGLMTVLGLPGNLPASLRTLRLVLAHTHGYHAVRLANASATALHTLRLDLTGCTDVCYVGLPAGVRCVELQVRGTGLWYAPNGRLCVGVSPLGGPPPAIREASVCSGNLRAALGPVASWAECRECSVTLTSRGRLDPLWNRLLVAGGFLRRLRLITSRAPLCDLPDVLRSLRGLCYLDLRLHFCTAVVAEELLHTIADSSTELQELRLCVAGPRAVPTTAAVPPPIHRHPFLRSTLRRLSLEFYSGSLTATGLNELLELAVKRSENGLTTVLIAQGLTETNGQRLSVECWERARTAPRCRISIHKSPL